MNLPEADDNDRTHKNHANTWSWLMIGASSLISATYEELFYRRKIVLLEENKLPPITDWLFSSSDFNAGFWACIMMMICRWTPLTSHNRAEIAHIRLVFFQIRVECRKRGPPGFQFFVCFDLIRSEDQSQCRILSQRGPPSCA